MILHSVGLDLRSTTKQDLDFVLAAEQGEPNRSFIGQWSREEHAAAIDDEDILHFIIQETSGEQTGYVILTGLQDPNLTVCIKRIVIQSKGRGYGTMTLRLLIDWIFVHTETHRLWLDVKDHNLRARHVYEGVGFTLEGTLRECVKVGESFESLQMMSILRQEFLERV
ncbi:GNAT family N-acetyltransferase [Paenibacillus sp. 19GGS1-52]|uniref:GNAT family N-acetyltransferase n=1 Tax=Paenibacillus sp. 19GGS1-52 TaxID=2758563 RepID=UPI001EFA8C51|nr:GNAT family N-acetyltransferase [Paenibacillus sp. 19GGS1-52]ULO07821.1 GNAT family N-acetyltransferase [Paenibacillus sp. 19GGS1-52]